VRVRASSRVSPKAIVEEPAAVEPGIDILAFDALANRTVRQTNTDESVCLRKRTAGQVLPPIVEVSSIGAAKSAIS
jgi:hypothetical protein